MDQIAYVNGSFVPLSEAKVSILDRAARPKAALEFPFLPMLREMVFEWQRRQLSRTMRNWRLKKVKSACVAIGLAVRGSFGSSLLYARPFKKCSATNPAADDGRLNRLVHELNNPLAIIRNYVAILETENAGKGGSQPELAIDKEEIDRVAKLLRSAREQAHPQANPEADSQPAVPGQVDLNRTIGDLVGLIRKSMPLAGPVEIRLTLADKLPVIVSDWDRLKQLLVNLIKNAMEAMPKGGNICVATAPWGLGEAGPSHVEIRVEDNGPGIPREVLARLYQQVASSKAGEHQGLGLAIVGQLVRELNGLINCRSGDDGTRFQVLLPMTQQAA